MRGFRLPRRLNLELVVPRNAYGLVWVEITTHYVVRYKRLRGLGWTASVVVR